MDEVRAGEPAAVDALGAWFDELDVPDGIDWTDEPLQRTLPASAETVIGFALDDAVGCQTLVNIQAARQMFAIREAFEVAKQNPRIYVPVGISDRDPKADDVEFAVRSVAFDLAQRLRLSETMVRSLAWQGDVLLIADRPDLLTTAVIRDIGPEFLQHTPERHQHAPAVFDRPLAGEHDLLTVDGDGQVVLLRQDRCRQQGCG